MEIIKIFSNVEDESENLYSVLMSEDELSLFSETKKELSKLDKLSYKMMGKDTRALRRALASEDYNTAKKIYNKIDKRNALVAGIGGSIPGAVGGYILGGKKGAAMGAAAGGAVSGGAGYLGSKLGEKFGLKTRKKINEMESSKAINKEELEMLDAYDKYLEDKKKKK